MSLTTHLVLIVISVVLAFQVGLKSASAEEGAAARQGSETHFVWMEAHPEYNAVLDEIHNSGAAGIAIDHWPRERYLSEIVSEEVLNSVRVASALARLLGYCPHQLGSMDVIYFAAPVLDDWTCRLLEVDELLFGREEECTVELRDSPALVSNLELLSRLPALRKLTVYTKRTDDQFMEAVRKVKVSGEMRLRDPSELAKKSGRVMGCVVDSDGKPVAGATVMIYSRDGEPVVGSWTRDNGIFVEWDIRNVPYRIEAFAPPPWLAAADSKVASSEPVNAEPGETDVRLVIDRTRLVPQPPEFMNVEDDDGKRIGGKISPDGVLVEYNPSQ